MAVNPYDPQRPCPPESFAGRAKLVERTLSALETASVRRSGTALMVHGHRASGKTSALRKIKALTRDASPDAIAIEVPLRERSSDTTLLQSIVAELVSDVNRKRQRDEARWRGAWERLKAVSVEIDTPLGGGSVLIEKGDAMRGSAATALAHFRDAAHALDERAILNIAIDDAEFLDEAGIGTLKTLAEADLPVPLVLAVSAGPELVERLSHKQYSPVARAFSGALFDMEDFTLPETREALESPLRGETTEWAEDAVRRIHDLSHGNPYLVKCFASAAFRPDARITADDVDRAVPDGLRTAGPWLSKELSRAADGDITAFARIARSGKSIMRSKEITDLGINSVYIGRLVKLGVLRKKGPGHYELRKAPAIAYYHQVERGLGG